MAPDNVGLEILDAVEQEAAPVGLGELRDSLEALDGIEPARPPEEVEVEAGLRVDGREDALPAVDHPVELVGRPAVEDSRGEASDREELARSGDATRERQGLADPAPIRQLVRQGPRRVVIAPLGRGVHSTSSRCHFGGLPPS